MYKTHLPKRLPRTTQSPKTHRHLYSSQSPNRAATTSSIATSFLQTHQSLGPQIRTQYLDANQLHLLTLTLNRKTLYPGYPTTTTTISKLTTPLPPGYHLAYFTPAFLESELGDDGTDVNYTPAAPFTRRMWAGGEVLWPRLGNSNSNSEQKGKPNLLKVGDEVTETTRVVSAEPKVVRKSGEEMIVVGVEKRFENGEGVAVVDRRNWVFREALPYPPQNNNIPSPLATTTNPSSSHTQNSPTKRTTPIHKRTFRQTPISLFRFSALTFNAHKIHYSLPWSQTIEGHRNIVVHGPLNLINILDLWRDVQYSKTTTTTTTNQQQKKQDGKDLSLIVPESISYRATNPIYVDEDYEIVLEEGDEGVSRVNVVNHEGVVCMKADIRG